MNKYLSLFLINLPRIGKKKLALAEKKLLENNITIRDEDVLAGISLSDLLRTIMPSFSFSETEIREAHTFMKQTVDKCYEIGITFIGNEEDGFPIKLKDIPSAPLYLFCKGNLSALFVQTNIAVIGTRMPTPHGYKVGVKFGEILADNNVTVVSGLALGCDTAGHIGCLNKKGKTVAVMAEGLHKIYPAQNKKLAQDIVSNGGCLVSEYPPGKNANKGNFVERDRLQSGLSDGIIVIETDVVGGTMHTVGYAIEQKRHLGAYKHNDKYATVKQAQGNISLINSHKARSLGTKSEIMEFIELCKNGSVSQVQKDEDFRQMSLFGEE